MKPSYVTNLMSSFYLWLDHELASIGGGFTQTSGKLYPVQDGNYGNSPVYSSPFRQWISDSSVSGAVVPSGVFSDGKFLTRQSGVVFNFNKGQVILPTGIGKPVNVTAQYTKKDFNIYYTDEREENLLFENAYLPIDDTF
jgi:hypothetical protein